MAVARRSGTEIAERVRVLERALAALADGSGRKESVAAEELRELERELKAVKLFLSRSMPEFKKEFPELRRKVGIASPPYGETRRRMP